MNSGIVDEVFDRVDKSLEIKQESEIDADIQELEGVKAEVIKKIKELEYAPKEAIIAKVKTCAEEYCDKIKKEEEEAEQTLKDLNTFLKQVRTKLKKTEDEVEKEELNLAVTSINDYKKDVRSFLKQLKKVALDTIKDPIVFVKDLIASYKIDLATIEGELDKFTKMKIKNQVSHRLRTSFYDKKKT